MRNKAGVFFFVLAWMAGTAAAQDAGSFLQAADRAMGASTVPPTATGRGSNCRATPTRLTMAAGPRKRNMSGCRETIRRAGEAARRCGESRRA